MSPSLGDNEIRIKRRETYKEQRTGASATLPIPIGFMIEKDEGK